MAVEEDDEWYYVDGVLGEFERSVLEKLDSYVGSIGKYYVGYRSIDRQDVK
jgi:hypothetical protein